MQMVEMLLRDEIACKVSEYVYLEIPMPGEKDFIHRRVPKANGGEVQ
jgi:hypothetical protein